MLADTFWSHVEKKASGCWEWSRSRTPQGYGQLVFRRLLTGAHRVAYTIAKGEIPEGMLILHSCDNPPCCNPDHLRAGTQKENGKDMKARKRCEAAWEKRRIVLGLETAKAKLQKAK